MPDLPEGCPGWLSEVVLGLLRSDHCEEERRLTPAQAVGMLEVGGVARQWEARQAAEGGRRVAEGERRAAEGERRAAEQERRAAEGERRVAEEGLQQAVGREQQAREQDAATIARLIAANAQAEQTAQTVAAREGSAAERRSAAAVEQARVRALQSSSRFAVISRKEQG